MCAWWSYVSNCGLLSPRDVNRAMPCRNSTDRPASFNGPLWKAIAQLALLCGFQSPLKLLSRGLMTLPVRRGR